jgi:hypothetical protein
LKNQKGIFMADPRAITGNKSSSLNLQARKTSSPKKSSNQAVNYFNAQNLLNKDQATSLARDTIANRISEDTHQVDKSKYNNVLRDYNTQASQNNCKGQCHGYEAGFEEEKEFNARMQEMHKRGYAPKGHSLTYRETNWLWKFGNGKDIWMDGNVLDHFRLPFSSRDMASPLPRLDDLKVHGSVGVNKNNDRVFDGLYDFNHQNGHWSEGLRHVRNYLNQKASKEHGTGQEFTIRYDYGDRGKVK